MNKYSILFICLCGALNLNAQFTEDIKGEFSGINITQADLDLLFTQAPDLYMLDIDYKGQSLVLPNFQKIEILAIRSDSLNHLILPDTLPTLRLIDFDMPMLRSLGEPILPKLNQLTLLAKLDYLPSFLCNCEELELVDLTNMKYTPVDTCFEQRFHNGDFNYSTCLILNETDILKEIYSPGIDVQYPSENYSEEEYDDVQLKRARRRLQIIKKTGGFVLAGVLFLLLKS